MSQNNHIQKVAIIGAGGGLGAEIAKALPHWMQITAVTRSASSSTSSIARQANVTVVRGAYDDADFLAAALAGHDALVVALGLAAPAEAHAAVLAAAGRARVPYILPTEFGFDTSRDALVAALPRLEAKRAWRAAVDAMPASRWIAVVTNGWLDWGLRGRGFGIDVAARRATLLGGGGVASHVSTVPFAGLAAARVLSLPRTAPAGEPSLEAYCNGFVYVKAITLTQREILHAVQRAVGCDGWEIAEVDVDAYVRQGRELLEQGHHEGILKVIYGLQFTPGLGADYDGPVANDILGLPQLDLDEVVREAVCEDKNS